MKRSEVKYYNTSWGEEASCPHCGSDVYWVECWDCRGEGYSYHDCGEDCCCCIDPQPNVVCDTCDSEGGWFISLSKCKGDSK